MEQIVRISSVVLLALLVVGCAGSPAWESIRISETEAEAKRNNENIMSINIGQSREEILRLMGQPAKRAAYKLENERIIEFLFYRTTGWSSDVLRDTDYQFTPMAFENNRLVGWGKNYYDNVVRAAVDVTIE